MKAGNRLKSLSINVGLLAASIFVFFIFFELFLRLFLPQPLSPLLFPTEDIETFGQFDPLLGWSLKPAVEAPHFSGEYNVIVKQNSHGMRDKEYKKKKSRDKYRIAVTGDSFVWGYGVNNDEIFTEVLEKKLGSGFEILNFGVSGYGTDQELLQFKSKILEFEPDMLIVSFYNNDIENIISSRQYGYSKPLFILENGSLRLSNVPVSREEIESRRHSLLDYTNFFLSHYSHAFVFLKQKMISFYYSAEVKWRAIFNLEQEYFGIRILKKDQDKQYKEGWELFDSILKEFGSVGKKNDIKIILMHMPDKVQVDKELFETRLRVFGKKSEDYDLLKPSVLLKQSAGRHNMTFIDILPYFLAQENAKRYYFRFDDHLNVEGNRAVAEALYKEIENFEKINS